MPSMQQGIISPPQHRDLRLSTFLSMISLINLVTNIVFHPPVLHLGDDTHKRNSKFKGTNVSYLIR